MISTKGRYALRVMIDLAERGGAGCVPLKDVADRQGISKKYLEAIVKDLVAAGFVAGVSGRSGGYRLCRKPEDYTIGEILSLMEGSFAAVAWLSPGAAPCPRAAVCKTLPLWKEYDGLTRSFFFGKRLSDYVGTEKDADPDAAGKSGGEKR